MARVAVVSSIVEVGLRTMGVWPGERYTILRRFICAMIIGIVETFQIQYLLTHVSSDSLSDLTENIAVALTDVLIFCKIIILWLNSRSICELIGAMTEDWRECLSSQLHVDAMTSKAELSDRISKAIVLSYGIAVMLVGSGVFTSQSSDDFHPRHEGFLLKMELPFDSDSSPNFEIIMIGQFIWQIALAAAGGITISLMITSVLHVDGQIEIIHRSLKEISEEKRRCGGMDDLLKMLIARHENVIDFSKTIEKLFSYVNFMEFLVTTMITACVGFVIVISDKDGRFLLKFLSYYIAANVDIFAHCFIGEYLGEKNNSIGDAAYKARWYELKPNECRYLLLLILRSQRKLTMTIGKFMDLSLECFTTMVKTSMSYISLLNAIY